MPPGQLRGLGVRSVSPADMVEAPPLPLLSVVVSCMLLFQPDDRQWREGTGPAWPCVFGGPRGSGSDGLNETFVCSAAGEL